MDIQSIRAAVKKLDLSKPVVIAKQASEARRRIAEYRSRRLCT